MAKPPPSKPPLRASPADPTTTEPSMPIVPVQPEGPRATEESVARRPPVRRVPVRRGSGQAPPRKGGFPVIGLLALVALGLGGYGAWKRFAPHPSAPAGPSAHELEVRDAAVAFQNAKNLIRAGQWKQAKERLDALNERVPELEGLKVYVQAAAVEAPLQEHLDAAETAVAKGDCARAATELKAIPDTSKQYVRRTEVDAKVDRLVDEKVNEGRALATAPGNKEKMRKLKALAEQVLTARPGQRDAQGLLTVASRALGAKAIVEAPAAPDDPAAPVIEQYASGNAAQALATAEMCAEANPHCSQLKQQLMEMNELSKKVESLDAEPLEHLVKLDRALSGGTLSALGRPAGVRLAALLYPKASSAAVRKQWALAMAIARKILEGAPNHDGAKGIVADGHAAANELYQRCYVGRAQSPDEALPLCKEVVQMLPEGDPLRVKAERLLGSGTAE